MQMRRHGLISFCLPVSNGHVERVFSMLKVIKSDRCNSHGEDRLDQLVRIKVDGPPFAQWDATPAVQLWWKAKLCRDVKDTRTPPTPSTSAFATTVDEEQIVDTLNLDDWDTFLEGLILFKFYCN